MDAGKRDIRALYDAVITDYAGSFDTKAGRYYLRRKMDAFLTQFPDRPPAELRVLEVGSADGVVTEQLVRLGCRVVSIDLSWSQLRRAQATVAGAAFVQADGEALPFRAQSFDVIVSMCTVRYFSRPDEAIAGWYDMLRPGGVLVVDVPNRWCPFFWGLNRWVNGRVGVSNPPRTATYSPGAIRRVFEASRFQAVRTRPILLVYRYFSAPAYYAARILEWLLERTGIGRGLLALVVCSGTRPETEGGIH